MIYRVKIDSWYRTGRPKVPTKRVRRIFLIEAADCERAMAFGRHHAEASARFGLDWIGFESREAAPVQLPFEIKA